MKKVLVTSVKGVIGFHFEKRIMKEGFEVVGLDYINDYYDVNLKFGKLNELDIQQDKIEKNVLIQSPTSIFKWSWAIMMVFSKAAFLYTNSVI